MARCVTGALACASTGLAVFATVSCGKVLLGKTGVGEGRNLHIRSLGATPPC